jgi:hypothetical protein
MRSAQRSAKFRGEAQLPYNAIQADINRNKGDKRDRKIPGMLLCHCEERLGSWSDAAIPVSIQTMVFTTSRRSPM